MSRALPPGEILLQDLKSLGHSQAELATLMGRSAQHVNDITKGKKRIDPLVAMELEEALGNRTATQWLELELEYQKSQLKTQAGNRKRKDVMTDYPFALEAVKQGWIKDSNIPTELESRIQAFLNQPVPPTQINYRMGVADTFEDSLKAWFIRVMNLVHREDVAGQYDPKRQNQLLKDLKACMRNEDDVRKVKGILSSYGIRFVIVPNLKKAPVDGVASYNDGKPFIALSLRNAQLDRFWFTLMHECGHILLEHSKKNHIELDNVDHRNDKNKCEQEADAFARNQLLDSQAFNQFANTSNLSLASIEEFAASQRVHRSIVIGRLKNEGWLTWVDFAREHPSVRDNLAGQQK